MFGFAKVEVKFAELLVIQQLSGLHKFFCGSEIFHSLFGVSAGCIGIAEQQIIPPQKAPADLFVIFAEHLHMHPQSTFGILHPPLIVNRMLRQILSDQAVHLHRKRMDIGQPSLNIALKSRVAALNFVDVVPLQVPLYLCKFLLD